MNAGKTANAPRLTTTWFMKKKFYTNLDIVIITHFLTWRKRVANFRFDYHFVHGNHS